MSMKTGDYLIMRESGELAEFLFSKITTARNELVRPVAVSLNPMHSTKERKKTEERVFAIQVREMTRPFL